VITARELVDRLGGRWCGSYGVARCVLHEDRTPSLSIRDSHGGAIVHCFAGCDFRDVRDELKRRGLLEGQREPSRERPRKPLTTPANDDAERTKRALEIWHEAKPLGALAQKYFASRGINMSEAPDMHHVLRFDPNCPFGAGERRPCIVSLWTDAYSGEPKAIHRTALNRDGTKLGRMSLGPSVGCVIRLWPDESVTLGLVIGEGIETTLAAAKRIEHRGTLLQPAWAVGDKGHLGNFPVLAGIEALTILVDNDERRTGQRAARQCVHRWTAAGREVTELIPEHLGCDFNDIVRERAHA
jgi:putative DNA primase/helicase